MEGMSNDKIEEAIQKATANSAHNAHLTPGRDTRTQLFVGNLPYRVRWQDLKDLFRQAGTVLRADVSLGPDNRSRGYGTVLLATAEDAGRAIDRFNGYCWQTRVLDVRVDRLPANGESSNGEPSTLLLEESEAMFPNSGKNLFVGNTNAIKLPFHIQWQDLKDLFRQAGTIIRADVALGIDGRSRGFGTVVFASEQDAERAVSMFNGYEFNGRQLKVHHDKYSHHHAAAAGSGANSGLLPSTPTNLSAASSPFLRSASPSASLLHPQSFGLTDLQSRSISPRSPALLGGVKAPGVGGFLDRDAEDAAYWPSPDRALNDDLTPSTLAASMRLGLNLLDNQTSSAPPTSSLLSANAPSLSRAASLNRASNYPLAAPAPSLNRASTTLGNLNPISSLHAASPSPLSLAGNINIVPSAATLPSSPLSSNSRAQSRLSSPTASHAHANKDNARFPIGDMFIPSSSGPPSASSGSRRGSRTAEDDAEEEDRPPWAWSSESSDGGSTSSRHQRREAAISNAEGRPPSTTSSSSSHSQRERSEQRPPMTKPSTTVGAGRKYAPARPNLNTSKTTPVARLGGGKTTSHPHHPGPISLPPLYSPLPPHMAGAAGSPMHSPIGPPGSAGIPHQNPHHPQGTPYGMPITPSMPPFNFLPPAAWTPSLVQTPSGPVPAPGQQPTPMATTYVNPAGYFGYPAGTATPPISPGFVYPPPGMMPVPQQVPQQFIPAPAEGQVEGNSPSPPGDQSQSGEASPESNQDASQLQQQQVQMAQQPHPMMPQPLFTPGVAMSPMSPFHPYPPGAGRVNPAVGGPVHLPHPQGMPMSPGGFYFSPMYYPVHPAGSPLAHPGHTASAGATNSDAEAKGYFDLAPPPPPPGMGYFPTAPAPPAAPAEQEQGEEAPTGGKSSLEKAIMRTPEDERKLQEGSAGATTSATSEETVNSPLSSSSFDEDDEEDGSVGHPSRRVRLGSETGNSSRATSWHTSDNEEKLSTGEAGASGINRAYSMQPDTGKKAGWMGKDQGVNAESKEAESVNVGSGGAFAGGLHPHRSESLK